MAARWSALTCRCASGGSSSTTTSRSSWAASSRWARSLQPLRLAVGRPGQDQPHVVVLLDEPVRVHHAERVVGAREPRDLHQQGLVARDAERGEDLADLARGEVAVALRERVDRRRDHVHRDAEPSLEPGQREDGRVVLVGEPPEERPRPRLRGRAIEVAPPDPAPPGPGTHETRRLAVVHERHVGVEFELLGVEPVHVHPAREPFVAEHPLGALERGLEAPRGRVVGGIAAGDFPARVDAQLAQDRYRGAQGLGRAAAEAATGHVQEAPALHLLGELQDEVDRARDGVAPVLVDPAHRRASSSAASTRPSSRPRIRSRVVR